MTVYTILMAAAALLPAIALAAYIYVKDRAEKEPVWLLLLLLGAGALITMPAAFLEEMLGKVQESFFSAAIVVGADGQRYLGTTAYYLYHIVRNFMIVGVVEEGLKLLVTWLITRNSKQFNSLFDGVVYCCFTSLGFAAAENVMYVFNYGWSAAWIRAFTAVPGHLFFGVLMGCGYSVWHIYRSAAQIERQFVREKRILRGPGEDFTRKHLLTNCFVLPVIVHGAYDYCCSLASTLSTVLFYLLLAALYFFCFRRVKRVSAADTSSVKLAMALVIKKYPSLTQDPAAAQIGTAPEIDFSTFTPAEGAGAGTDDSVFSDAKNPYSARNNPYAAGETGDASGTTDGITPFGG